MNLPPCTSCGACCSNPDPKWIEVSTWDARWLALTDLQVGDVDVFAMRQDVTGRCCCLEGQIGVDGHCGIYSLRPAICAAFPRGGPGCLEAMRRLGVQ